MVMPVGCRALTLGLVYKGFNGGEKVLTYFHEYFRFDIGLDQWRTFIVASRLRTSPVISDSEKSTFAFQSWVKNESRNWRGVNFSRISCFIKDRQPRNVALEFN